MSAFTPDQKRRLREIDDNDDLLRHACRIVDLVKNKKEEEMCNPVPSEVRNDLKRAAKLMESLSPAAKNHIRLWIDQSLSRFMGLSAFSGWGISTPETIENYESIYKPEIISELEWS
ncbi:MAG: hypothetical protein AB2792_17705, partial [Candidatus Thiodiazotropha sp.]